ncbi:HutD/Ves family protein [Ideonella paludis]|uniref:HutD family protein n=1 Tax=Ideonella paludis TaxID=1233411 RepID=A0ABS5DXS8_9BURK|nr:HutD family protein [Ideonella paludis]MBQ0935948.1 HutD family protein [Ideonella paludis]
MTPRLIPLQSRPAQAWRNGGGQTRELLAWPEAVDWRLRISVADVAQEGPFSLYPGVQRHLAVWQGAGLALHREEGGAEPITLTPSSPAWAFEGEWRISASLLDGPVRDLNLMCRGLPGELRPAVAGHLFAPAHRAAGLFATQPGVCWARPGAGGGDLLSWPLRAETLCWFDAAPAEIWWAPDLMPLGPGPSAWWLSADMKDE